VLAIKPSTETSLPHLIPTNTCFRPPHGEEVTPLPQSMLYISTKSVQYLQRYTQPKTQATSVLYAFTLCASTKYLA